MSNPEMTQTSYDFIREWMLKAKDSCFNQGRNDAGFLWQDAIEHLDYSYQEIERLSKLIETNNGN